MQPGPTFPNLGIPDNRRETPVLVAESIALLSKRRVIASHYGLSVLGPSYQEALGLTSRLITASASYSISVAEKSDLATAIHEDFHLIMNRVEAKYSRRTRAALARHLYESMPRISKAEFQKWYKETYPRGCKNHEEWIASLLDWHNDPELRDNYEIASASLTKLTRLVQQHQAMKSGLRAVRKAAAQVTLADLMARSRKR